MSSQEVSTARRTRAEVSASEEAVASGRGRYSERQAGREPWFYKDRTGEREYAWIPFDYFP